MNDYSEVKLENTPFIYAKIECAIIDMDDLISFLKETNYAALLGEINLLKDNKPLESEWQDVQTIQDA